MELLQSVAFAVASSLPRPSHCQSWSFSITLSTTLSVTKLQRCPVHYTVNHGVSALPCPPHCQQPSFSVALSTTLSVTVFQRYPVDHTVSNQALALPCPPHCPSRSFSVTPSISHGASAVTLSTTLPGTELQGYPVHHTVNHGASALPCLLHCQ